MKTGEPTFLPDWYWKTGLHDAKVKEINELKLEREWKAAYPAGNLLELCLDCKNAIFERNIKKIILLNYTLHFQLPEKGCIG